MAADKLDYASVISDIRAKIAALQAILTSVESAAMLGALGQSIEGVDLSPALATRNGDLGVPTDLPEGAFHGKSVPACVELYLSAVKKKKTNKDIAAALREGGVESNASNFENVVTGALFGLKKAGKVLRFKDGWGLAEWYPANIRAVTPAATSKRAKKGKKKQKKSPDVRQVSAEMGAPATSHKLAIEVKDQLGTEFRVKEFFNNHPRTEFSAANVADPLKMDLKKVRLALGRLASRQ